MMALLFRCALPCLESIACCVGNGIGDEGARCLADALARNATLTTLNVSGVPTLPHTFGTHKRLAETTPSPMFLVNQNPGVCSLN